MSGNTLPAAMRNATMFLVVCLLYSRVIDILKMLHDDILSRDFNHFCYQLTLHSVQIPVQPNIVYKFSLHHINKQTLIESLVFSLSLTVAVFRRSFSKLTKSTPIEPFCCGNKRLRYQVVSGIELHRCGFTEHTILS
ncbi:hypothetical protein L1987_35696 [Smallanthus sonchifolius]|uniref:Uncharacterized protein n=1 Tax=Smallanthus sonchifolius TaxID=185202 RepID=A0ACB9HCP6_9ASTR|nr:hypothetical protein L1987_35696 [Smallanthus sonchifolius]